MGVLNACGRIARLMHGAAVLTGHGAVGAAGMAQLLRASHKFLGDCIHVQVQLPFLMLEVPCYVGLLPDHKNAAFELFIGLAFFAYEHLSDCELSHEGGLVLNKELEGLRVLACRTCV